MKKPTRYRNQSIERTFRILKVLGSTPYYFRLADVARRAELSPPTTYRLLATLTELGAVNKDPLTGRYGLGLQIYRLAHRETYMRGLQRLAQPVLRDLSGQLGMTVHLAAFDGLQAIIQERIAAAAEDRLPIKLGMRVDTHATALGKAMLAFRPPAESLEIFRNHPLPAHTAQTIRNATTLERELAQIRARGFAIDHGELFPDIRCVAAPILNTTERGNIAISIAGRAEKLSPRRIEQLGKQIVEAAGTIQEALRGVARKRDA